ncbi:hypothetical protein SAMD00019534_114580 [Acytostelium subglobosum LB1]|uniref:hypothetical protein n=1 Tax=Acytostelium subglobosum LB1 TaxID=1410327 RepID=UPI000644F2C5|nr:hypothetical protein SAMD00019534_114580 [Acytostelium subglobosum LB1]GAM28282.1 hypothetical protein SAMD00019534_114580 [Acytostelium subglobosum LB1]|eukprot:XP_012748916.1 hypothetical protein SAMD00019534_114580 [Acytostelium subglobosum LB1]
MVEKTSKFKLAFVGPVCSGKTTLINTLFGVSLPIVTTTRITILRYSTLAESSVSFHKLVPSGTEIIADEPVISLATVADPRQATKIAWPLLRRPAEEDDNSIDEWTQKIVVISYPIPMLEGGLEVYDIPGTRNDEHVYTTAMRSNFFSHVSPNAAVFCYVNPAFSDTEVQSYKDFKSQTKIVDGFDLDSHVFFANTKFNVAAFKNSQNLDNLHDVTDEHLLQEEISIFQQLSVRKVLNGRAKPSQFSLVNSMDFLAAKHGSKRLFGRFVERLTRWMISIRHSIIKFVLDELIELCQRFYTFVLPNRGVSESPATSSSDFPKQVDQFLNNLWLQYKESIMELPKLLTQQCEVSKDVAMEMAGDIELQQYDGKEGNSSFKLEAIGAFKAKISRWFFDNITSPVVMTLRGRLEIKCNEAIQSQQNNQYILELLKDKEYSLDSLTWDIGKKLFDSLSQSLRLQHRVQKPRTSLTPNKKVINKQFKRRIMEKILSLCGYYLYMPDMVLGIEKVFQDYMKEMKAPISIYTRFLAKLESLRTRIEDLSSLHHKIGMLHMETMANQFKLNNPFHTITGMANIVGYGPSGVTFAGVLGGRTVYVKQMAHIANQPSPTITPSHLAFFEEAYYTLLITDKDGDLLPLLAVFHDTTCTQLVYPSHGVDLMTYLDNNPVTYYQGLVIAESVARAIEEIHTLGFNHHDIRLENIFINATVFNLDIKLGNIGCPNKTLASQLPRRDVAEFANVLVNISNKVNMLKDVHKLSQSMGNRVLEWNLNNLKFIQDIRDCEERLSQLSVNELTQSVNHQLVIGEALKASWGVPSSPPPINPLTNSMITIKLSDIIRDLEERIAMFQAVDSQPLQLDQ